jgi:ADP-ribose pyrophosphatase YjhB (NUDIX family)
VVAVTGVVTDEEGRVLLVRGDHRGWEPPGGQVEHGEDLVSALQREVKEESGCEVEVMGLLGVYSNLGRPERGVPEQVHLVFGCEWVRGEPRAGNECLEAGWFGPEEALRLVEAPQQRAKLEDALAGSGLWYRAFRTQPYESVLDRRLDRKERNTCRPRRRPPTS